MEWHFCSCLHNIFAVVFKNLKINYQQNSKSKQALNMLQVKASTKNSYSIKNHTSYFKANLNFI